MKRSAEALGVVAAWLCVLTAAAPGNAEPADLTADPGTETVESPVSVPATVFDARGQSDEAVAAACDRFNAALDLAAVHYEEFAYATAGTGDYVNYQDPTVQRTNVIGRTALREASVAALNASRDPSLPPEISDPMRAWSVRAAKLVLVMGLRGGGDTLNETATALNADAAEAQLACAARG